MSEILHGRFRIISRLGSGGSCEVFEARDLRLDRAVAIKRVKDLENRGRLGERLLEEACHLASVHHPNVVAIHDVIQDRDGVAIVLELVDGGPLLALIRKRPLTQSELMGCFLQLLDAVEAVHAAGLIHRDLNPKNVLIDARGLVKLVDFGLSTKADDPRPRLGGTLGYLAPEILREGRDGWSRSADLYSLGFLAYQSLLGLRAFKRLYGTRKPREWMRWVLSREPFKPLSDIAPDVPPEVSRIIARLLEKDVKERYRSIGDVRSDLQTFLAFGSKTAPRSHERIRIPRQLAPSEPEALDEASTSRGPGDRL